MGRIPVPDTLNTELADLQRRMRVLENTPRMGAGVLNRVAYVDTTQNQNYVLGGADQDLAMTTQQSWQVNSRSRFLVLAIIGGKTSGGSGNFAYVKFSTRSGGPGSEVDVFGNAVWDKGLAGYTTPMVYRHLDIVNFPVTLRVYPVAFGDSGQTLAHYYCHIDVYALGA